MLFQQVIGHQNLKKRLIENVKSGKVSHSQLFLGEPGAGSLAIALAYTQYLFCQNKQDNDSCGECNACLKVQKLVHPDLHFVYPVNTTKKITEKPISKDFIADWREFLLASPYANLQVWLEKIGIENKQGIIATRESSEIISELNKTAYEAGYKVMLIWCPEKLNNEAANKLLKIIEEPPKKTIFLLVSNDLEKILGTIVSRTQIIKVPLLSDDDIEKYLIQKHNLTEESAHKISLLSEGSVFVADELASGKEESDYSLLFQSWMRYAFVADVPELIKWTEETASMGKEQQKNLLTFGLSVFRESLMNQYASEEIQRFSGKDKQFIHKFSPFVNGANAADLMQLFNDSIYHLERNVNSKILFLDISFKIAKLLRVKNVTLQES